MTESIDTWILFDAAVPGDCRVLAVGNTARNGTAWRSLGRLVVQRELARVTPAVMRNRGPVDRVREIQGAWWRIVVEPVLSSFGDVHAVMGLVTQRLEAPLPPRPVVGAWTWDVHGRLTHWTDEMRELYKVPLEDRKATYSPAEFFRWVDVADYMKLRFLWGTILTDGNPALRFADYTIVRGDGIRRNVHLSARPVFADQRPGGSPIQFRGITHDVTPAAAPESALPAGTAVSEGDLVKGIVQLTTVSMGVMDGNYGQITHWLTEPPPELVLQTSMIIADHCPPDDRPRLADFIASARASPEVIHTVVRLHGRDGGWVPTRLSGVRETTTADGSPQIIMQFTPLREASGAGAL